MMFPHTRYDFPLLRSELDKATAAAASSSSSSSSSSTPLLPENLLCVDTLTAMREIFREELDEATRREVEDVARLVERGAMDDDGFRPLKWDEEPLEMTPAVVTPTKVFLSAPDEDEDDDSRASSSTFSLPVTPPSSDTKKKPRFSGDAARPKPCFKNLAVRLLLPLRTARIFSEPATNIPPCFAGQLWSGG